MKESSLKNTEVGDAAAAGHHARALAEQRGRRVPVDTHREVAQQPDSFGGLENEIGHVVGEVGAVGIASGEGDGLDIVVEVELAGQFRHGIESALAVGSARREVGLVVGLEKLVEPSSGSWR